MSEEYNNKSMLWGRKFSNEETELIKEIVKMYPNLSRRELASTICEQLSWNTATGTYKITACLKLLKNMEDAKEVKLPKKKHGGSRSPKVELTDKSLKTCELNCNLADIDSVSIKMVLEKSDIKLFNEYIERYHYLKYKQPFGTPQRYFIISKEDILGCILMTSPARSIANRDKWIGWTPEQRSRNIHFVVNQTRFLIMPSVKIKNLASYSLSILNKRIREDWQERWGYKPVLLETFVDHEKYYGTVYKSSNWNYLGMTTGIGRLGKGSKSYKSTPKAIYVKPLVKDFRKILCGEIKDREFKKNEKRKK
ncbi:MAG: DUF4338 domain-containing protein [Bacteroidetes bacterium]|nr:DUF4338 domain-containing protein [Bacteroidota bacterium]